MKQIKILNQNDLEGYFTNGNTYELISDTLSAYNPLNDEMEDIEATISNRIKYRKATRWIQLKDNTGYCCLLNVNSIETRFQFI